MHAHPRFQWTDRAELRAFVADRSFGTLILANGEGTRIAQVPLVWMNETQLGLHLSRANGLARDLDGARCMVVVTGADGYVSPDWYGIDDQVPTWNYVSAELEGVARLTDDLGLMAVVDALSWEHERRLAPKAPWTRAKMSAGVFEKMANAIVGFTLEVEQLRGTRKLGQNKADEVRSRAADGAEAAGNADLARAMRDVPDRSDA